MQVNARISAVAAMVALTVLAASCEKARQAETKVFDRGFHAHVEADRKAIKAAIAELHHWRSIDDPESAAAYDEAKAELTAQGVAAEPELIEAIYESDEWGVRYGCIEVLDSVGTRNCVDVLIHCLQDPHPEVALKAVYSLRGMLGHREIPASGRSANGLEPVPERGADDLDPEADMRIWTAWYESHGADLHRAWKNWWETNRRTAEID